MEIRKKHLYIPDTQVRPGVPLQHLNWIGQFIVDKKPDVIIQAGDFADMHSLSSYDVGKKAGEGARYQDDIAVAKEAMSILLAPLNEYNKQRRKIKAKQYKPRMILTLGNHEDRITRHINNHPVLEGHLSLKDLGYEQHGFEVYQYLEPVEVDGILYCHFFPRNASGRIVQTKSGAPCARLQVQREGQSCTSGHLQGLDVHVQQRGTRRDWGMIAGSCLTPDHKVLMENLEYKFLGDLQQGDKIISFEEFPISHRSRRFKTGTIEKIRFSSKDVFNVYLSDGTMFTTTADHNWLVRSGCGYSWIRTDKMVTNHKWRTRVPRLFDTWETDTSYEAGYISGILDGEGTLYNRQSSAYNISFSQRDNEVLAKSIEYLNILGIPYTKNLYNQGTNKDVWTVRLSGTSAEKAKVLGSLRPERLINKSSSEHFGRIMQSNDLDIYVERIEPAGKKDIVMTSIDTKTMIVDGVPHHNCYLHQEDYLSPQGTAYWRGVIMKHDVHDGDYCPMFVDLDYLERKYG